MASKPLQNNDVAGASEAPQLEVEEPMDGESLNQLLLRLVELRLVELESEKSNKQTTRLTMASITNKDKAKENYTNRKLVQCAMLEGYIGSKALPSQYEHKADTTHDKTACAVRHHTGSHYHMAGSVQFQRG